MQLPDLRPTSLLLAGLMLIPAIAADPPDNDNKADAEWLLLTASANTFEANTDGPRFTCTHLGKDVWYRVVGVPGLEINTEGSDFDTTLALFDENGKLVACNDNTGGGQQSKLFVPAAGIFRLQAGGMAAWTTPEFGNLVVNASP